MFEFENDGYFKIKRSSHYISFSGIKNHSLYQFDGIQIIDTIMV